MCPESLATQLCGKKPDRATASCLQCRNLGHSMAAFREMIGVCNRNKGNFENRGYFGCFSDPITHKLENT